jgi:hypothetical protein
MPPRGGTVGVRKRPIPQAALAGRVPVDRTRGRTVLRCGVRACTGAATANCASVRRLDATGLSFVRLRVLACSAQWHGQPRAALSEVRVHPWSPGRPPGLCPVCGVTQPIAREPISRRRALDVDIIEGCVRWYSGCRLSYRDLVEMMAERDVDVTHWTILRRIMRDVPECEMRWNRFSRAVGTSRWVGGTYISIEATRYYHHPAVGRHGQIVGVLLRRDRRVAAARAFFRMAFASEAPRVPRKVMRAGHVAGVCCGCCGVTIRAGARSMWPRTYSATSASKTTARSSALRVDGRGQVVRDRSHHDRRH